VDPLGLKVTPSDVARVVGMVCVLDGPEPGPADILGGGILLAAGLMAIGNAITNTHVQPITQTCTSCQEDLEKCRDKCVRAWDALYDDCTRRFSGNPRALERCYASIAEILADCMTDCRQRFGR